MRRLCSKLARELEALASDLAIRIIDLPADVNPEALANAELRLRDALANLRTVRNQLADMPVGAAVPSGFADDDDAA